MQNLTDREIALRLAQALRAWRISPQGARMTQKELARKSGVGLTPLKRFEKTGGTTLNNLIAMLRAMNLLSGLEHLVPAPDTPSPLELLEASRRAPQRVRATKTERGQARGQAHG